MERRTFLKLAMAVTGTAALGLGIDHAGRASAPPTAFPAIGKFGGQPLEARVDANGQVQPNPDVVMRHSVCMGCYSSCSNRVKIDKKSGKILRVMGNPYSPKCAEPTLPYDSPLADAYKAFGLGKEGHKHRATVCARGNATYEQVYDPMRILTPLKRSANRGEGKWKPITWDELIKETVEGGQLFKDMGDNTVIEGFRQVRSLTERINPEAPEMGPKSNGLVWNSGGSYGRVNFAQRFVLNSFGSVNFFGHTGT